MVDFHDNTSDSVFKEIIGSVIIYTFYKVFVYLSHNKESVLS